MSTPVSFFGNCLMHQTITMPYTYAARIITLVKSDDVILIWRVSDYDGAGPPRSCNDLSGCHPLPLPRIEPLSAGCPDCSQTLY
jgi:hypothetical protein